MRIETAIGVLPVEVTRAYDGTMHMATVDMGEPRLLPDQIPTKMGCEAPEDPVVNCPLETELGTIKVTCVSMGNPHCVVFVDDVESAPVHTLGPVIETHPDFPNKTNVEFAQVGADDDDPAACLGAGSGRDARVRDGRMRGHGRGGAHVPNRTDATVELPGGELTVHWGEDGHVHMTGPAVEVFSGVVTIPEDDD